jgi:hypothetical protein
MVAKFVLADKKSGFPSNTRVLTPEKMSVLLDNLEKFFQALVHEMPSSLDPKKLSKLLPQFGIASEQFVGKYTVPVKFQ